VSSVSNRGSKWLECSCVFLCAVILQIRVYFCFLSVGFECQCLYVLSACAVHFNTHIIIVINHISLPSNCDVIQKKQGQICFNNLNRWERLYVGCWCV
jgi:hypothetical protein